MNIVKYLNKPYLKTIVSIFFAIISEFLYFAAYHSWIEGLYNSFFIGFATFWIIEVVILGSSKQKEFENVLFDKVVKSFYTGLYTLVSGSNKILENELKVLDSFSEKFYHYNINSRSLLQNFILDSIKGMSKGGFICHNTSVVNYVKYLRDLVRIPHTNALATCLVRPFWFVTDSLMIDNGTRIVLEPKIDNPRLCGKAEHLKEFKSNKEKRFKRLIIFSDEMLCEIFLSAYIDLIRSKNMILSRKRKLEKQHEITEIEWFQKEVNEKQKVTLYYAHKTHGEISRSLNVLGDRVIVIQKENERAFYISIEFEFKDLENGQMVLTWGDQISAECKQFVSNLDEGSVSGV